MKKHLGIFIASVCLLFGLSVVTSAQTNKGYVAKRFKIQQKRIFKGVQNGSVTGKEYKKLQKQQIKTKKVVKKVRSDGEVTNKEKARVHHRFNKNSRSIFRAKHNKRSPKP